MTTITHFNADAIRKLAEILADTNLTEIEYEEGEARIYLARHPAPVNVTATAPMMAAAPAPFAHPSAAFPSASEVVTSTSVVSSGKIDFHKHPGAIKSPMVGTVYLAPAPGAAPFVKVGDKITEGQVLLIVEAMKVMNPIKASISGTLTHLLVADASPVEYDQPLVVIE